MFSLYRDARLGIQEVTTVNERTNVSRSRTIHATWFFFDEWFSVDDDFPGRKFAFDVAYKFDKFRMGRRMCATTYEERWTESVLGNLVGVVAGKPFCACGRPRGDRRTTEGGKLSMTVVKTFYRWPAESTNANDNRSVGERHGNESIAIARGRSCYPAITFEKVIATVERGERITVSTAFNRPRCISPRVNDGSFRTRIVCRTMQAAEYA